MVPFARGEAVSREEAKRRVGTARFGGKGPIAMLGPRGPYRGGSCATQKGEGIRGGPPPNHHPRGFGESQLALPRRAPHMGRVSTVSSEEAMDTEDRWETDMLASMKDEPSRLPRSRDGLPAHRALWQAHSLSAVVCLRQATFEKVRFWETSVRNVPGARK